MIIRFIPSKTGTNRKLKERLLYDDRFVILDDNMILFAVINKKDSCDSLPSCCKVELSITLAKKNTISRTSCTQHECTL